MKWQDVAGSAITSIFRGRIRTVLTVVAVFIGAFTLTLTSGMGTGVNEYIDETVAAFGDTDTLYVQKSQPLLELSTGTGPRAYDPEDTQVSTGFGMSFAGLSEENIAAVEDTPG